MICIINCPSAHAKFFAGWGPSPTNRLGRYGRIGTHGSASALHQILSLLVILLRFVSFAFLAAALQVSHRKSGHNRFYDLKLETMPADCATVRTTIKSPLCQ